MLINIGVVLDKTPFYAENNKSCFVFADAVNSDTVFIDTNSTFSLYLALAIIICGYGLFKSNISCLLGELYDENDRGQLQQII